MKNNFSILTYFKKDRWVKPYFKKYRKMLFLALFLGFLTFFCAGALMFNSGYLISRAASLPENILLIYVPIVLTRAFGIGRPVFRYLERLISHNWVLKMTSDLRLKLYNALEKEGIFLNDHYKTGDILGLLSEDINHIQNLYLRTVFPTAIAFILYIFIVIGLGFFSLTFAFWMLLLLAVIIFLFPLVSVLINGAHQEQQKSARNELYSTLTDNVLGVSDWMVSQQGKRFVAHYERKEVELREIDRLIKRNDRRHNFFLQLFFGVIAMALVVWTSQRFVGDHGGAANWIAAFVLTLFPLIDAFAPLSDAAQETNIYKDSIQRLNRLPQADIQKMSVPNLLTETANFDLEVKSLNFSYEGAGKKVLENLNLTIPFKEKIAILGKSGSGKSTFAALLRGDLKPDSGSVELNHFPTSDFGDAMSKYMGVIHQNTYLFHTTVLNNLRIGREKAEEAEVWQVLEQVGLKEMIERLPEGINTMVDEAGLRFSGGERHRLALARILLQQAPIIILDEPTLGLDPITENQLLDTFFEVLQEKTVIWITHHLQGVSHSDRVIFIEEGRLEMSGSSGELLVTNARYRSLMAIDQGTA